MMNFTQSIVGKVVLGSIVLMIIVVFTLEFRAGSGSPTATLQTECAVEIGRDCLDAKDFFAAYGLLVGRGISAKDARALELKRRTLDGLAERELLFAEAKRLGLGVSDDVIDKELMAGRARVSLPAAHMEMLSYQLGLCRTRERGYGCEPGTPLGVRQLRVRRTSSEAFDIKVYERDIRLLANRGPKEFRAGLERELVADRLRDLVRSRARVPEAEARAIFDRGRSTAVIRSVTLDGSWFGKYAVDTTSASVAAWVGTHALEVDEAWKAGQKGIVAGCPVVREIVVASSPMAAAEEKAPLRERAESLRVRVTKGEGFEAVAREASNAETAAFGGLVGCVSDAYGPGSDVLSAAAGKLAPGAVSEVLETPFGFHVLKVESKLDAATVEAQGKQQIARGLYLKAAQRDAARAFASELVKQTKAGAKLEEVTRALTDELARRSSKPASATTGEAPVLPALLAADRPRFEISPPFTISGNPLPDVDAREPLAARAFELKEPDTVDEKPIETSNGLVVIQLKEKVPTSKEDFEKEKWAELRAMTIRKGNEGLVRYVAELRRAAGSKLKIDARYAEESKTDATE